MPATRTPAEGEPGADAQGKRRRRSREAASAEIVAAAEAFLRERPFRDLSVEEVMARTSLSRSSFYVYFRDRYDLLLRVVQEIGDQLFAMAERWLAGTGEPSDDVRRAIDGVVSVYAEHGLVMRAISDASSVDPAVEGVYHALLQRFIDTTTARLQIEVAAGRARAWSDPDECACALIWLTERYLSQSLGTAPPRISRERAIGTLHELWVRVLYGVA